MSESATTSGAGRGSPVEPNPWLPRPVPVLSVQQELADTVSLVLPPEASPGARPGQFNMLYAFGKGEVPISFSRILADGRVMHTIRAVGPASLALTRLKPGMTVGVRGPFGTAWPVDAVDGRDVLVVAGGIGVAPLRPVLDTLAARPGGSGRLILVAGARSSADFLFYDELRALRRWEFHPAVDRGDRDWHGHIGLVTELLPRLSLAADRTLAMTCGPEVMMRHVARGLTGLGVADTAIHLSMERNMKCALGLCGRCQWGGNLICRDGAVFTYAAAAPLLRVRGL